MDKIYDVVAIGLQVIDLIVYKVDSKILERDLTTVESVKMMLGGDALNQALTLAKIGARTAVMGVVGNDGLGDTIISRLKDSGVAVLNKRENVGTAISIVLIEENGDRHFVYQPDSNEALSYRHVDEDAVRAARVLSIGGSMGLTGLDGEDTIRLLKLAKQNGTVTGVDFTIARDSYDMSLIRQEISLCDYVLPSEIEAAYLTGEKEPGKMAEKLHSFGAENVVIKLGSEGCLISSSSIRKMIPACPCRCIDTTGAGDSFSAAFLYGISQGWDMEKSAAFGNAAGSITVEHIGANSAIRSIGQIFDRMNQLK